MYISPDYDLQLADYDLQVDVTSKIELYIEDEYRSAKNKRVKSKFSECPDFRCSRSHGTLEPVTSSFPAVSESLRANSQSSAVIQPDRPLTHSFAPVRVQGGKIR